MNKKKSSRSIIPTVFTKKVYSFSEAMGELVRVELIKKILDDSYIQNYFNTNQDADEDTEFELGIEEYYEKLSFVKAQQMMIDLIHIHLPDVENSVNEFWQINMASTRCYIKTGMNIGFGWQISLDRNDNDNVIKDITIKVVLYNQMKTANTFNYLAKNGWEIGP